MIAFSSLPPFKMQSCCDEGCGCKTANPNADLLCPHCGQAGKAVSNLTVYSLCTKAHKPDINRDGDDTFALCMTPECDIAYYNAESTIPLTHLKRDIHFKTAATTRYVCHCLKITHEQIEKTIQTKRLTGMQDIMRALVGPPPCRCEKNNPTGLCCDAHFNEVIVEYLARHS